MIRKPRAAGVRLVIYRTGDRQAPYTRRKSAEAARNELLALEFKLVSRFAHREYWRDRNGLRALIVPESWVKRLENL